MHRNKLFQFSLIAVLVAAVSFGFLNLSNDDQPTTASDFLAFGYQSDNSGNVTVTPDLVGAWTAGANVPTGRYHGQGAGWQSGNTSYLFFLGGDNSGSGTLVNTVNRYDVGTNTWTTVASMPTTVWYTDAVTLGNYVYICGGMTTSAFASQINTVQRYDIIGNTWSTVTGMPSATGQNIQVAYQDSLIYSMGGFMNNGSTAMANVYLYNSISNTWRIATPLPAARSGGTGFISNDTIVYICGGTGYSTGLVNTVYVGKIGADRSSITWTTAASYPGTGRHRFTSDKWGCKGGIVGPSSASGFTVNSEIYVFSPGANTWTPQANLPVATSSSHVGSFNMGNNIWKYITASGLVMTPPYSILNTQIFTDTLPCQPPQPQGILWTLCRNNVMKYIPDNTTIYDTINFGGNNACQILDVNVKIDTVTHTWDSDLTFAIRHNSTTVTLVQNRGGSGDNFIGCILNDSAANPISAGTAPFTGSWRPEQVLSAFNGQSPSGAWILSINDNAGGDNGYLKAWCIAVTFSCPTGIQTIEIPSYYSLSQNYPNPFNPSTNIKYTLPKGEFVKLVVYDITGKEVRTLVNEYKQQGVYNIPFDASSLASGVYFYRIDAGTFTETKKMMFVK